MSDIIVENMKVSSVSATTMSGEDVLSVVGVD